MMKVTHWVQLGLSVLAAAAGAAVPLMVTPMTPTAWLVLVAAEALAIKSALSVQSEVSGDKGTPPAPANTNGGSK